MTKSLVTRILNSETLSDTSMSLGFRRYLALPSKKRLGLNVAHLLETGSMNAHARIVTFFEEMTSDEYRTYLTTH